MTHFKLKINFYEETINPKIKKFEPKKSINLKIIPRLLKKELHSKDPFQETNI